MVGTRREGLFLCQGPSEPLQKAKNHFLSVGVAHTDEFKRTKQENDIFDKYFICHCE